MALLSTCTLNFVCSKCSGIVVHSSRRSSAVLHQFRDGNDYKHIMVSGSNDVLRRLRLQAPQRACRNLLKRMSEACSSRSFFFRPSSRRRNTSSCARAPACTPQLSSTPQRTAAWCP